MSCGCDALVALAGEPARSMLMETWLHKQMNLEGLQLRTGEFFHCSMPKFPHMEHGEWGIQFDFDGKSWVFPWPHVYCALDKIRTACCAALRDLTDPWSIDEVVEHDRERPWKLLADETRWLIYEESRLDDIDQYEEWRRAFPALDWNSGRDWTQDDSLWEPPPDSYPDSAP